MHVTQADLIAIIGQKEVEIAVLRAQLQALAQQLAAAQKSGAPEASDVPA